MPLPRAPTGPGLLRLPPEHDSLIGGVRIVKAATHFHFDFMDEELLMANLFFHLTQLAQ